MNLVSIKSLTEIALKGVSIDWTREDKSVKEVRIQDDAGNLLVLKAGDYGSTLKVMVPQPHEMADRYLLSGKYIGLVDVSEHFEYEHEAQDKLRDYESKCRGESGLAVTKVSVRVDDGGAIVNCPTAAGDEIPF